MSFRTYFLSGFLKISYFCYLYLGGPLLDVLRNKQPIDDRRKIGFCADAANALAYLEETRTIHR